jgi:P4 family phage/plasmid primase-like protien
MHLADPHDPLDHLALLNKPASKTAALKWLQLGSDVEIAHRVSDDLERDFGDILHAEGRFWRYGKTHWEDIPDHELRMAAHIYDGACYTPPVGKPSYVKLGKSRVDSILHEMAATLTKGNFFAGGVTGINCASGFIRLDDEGLPQLEVHNPDHRCRHTLPGRWSTGMQTQPPQGSLLQRLLDGVFRDDDDREVKINLLAEIIGSAALGCATRLRQPRAVILKGETAENGKSQILDLARSLLPPSAICSVTAARMGDERHIVGLIGKLLNASDELSSAQAIASDTFKAIVTGEPVQGRDVYKSRIEFRPVAQHLFATNTLPVFSGGMDRGVQRRLLVIAFTRLIPYEERIEGIGRRIGEEEADLLLAWAVAGASRLVRQRGFTIPPSSKIAMNEWLFGADPVLAWLSEQIDIQPVLDTNARIRTSHAYEMFRNWATAEGFSDRTLPSINAFVQRLQANAKGIEYRRTREGRFFYGMTIGKSTAAQPAGW